MLIHCPVDQRVRTAVQDVNLVSVPALHLARQSAQMQHAAARTAILARDLSLGTVAPRMGGVALPLRTVPLAANLASVLAAAQDPLRPRHHRPPAPVLHPRDLRARVLRLLGPQAQALLLRALLWYLRQTLVAAKALDTLVKDLSGGTAVLSTQFHEGLTYKHWLIRVFLLIDTPTAVLPTLTVAPAVKRDSVNAIRSLHQALFEVRRVQAQLHLQRLCRLA